MRIRIALVVLGLGLLVAPAALDAQKPAGTVRGVFRPLC